MLDREDFVTPKRVVQVIQRVQTIVVMEVLNAEDGESVAREELVVHSLDRELQAPGE